MLTNEIAADIARNLGFDLVGFSEAAVLEREAELLEKWLQSGFHAGMHYMERNLEKRRNVKEVLPEAKSVISLGLNYNTPEEHSENKENGKISRYAWGKDYHLLIWKKLDRFVELMKKIDQSFNAKTYVDTGPVMDKVWAVRSGLGWIGKNTNVINKDIGSWFFIATVITNYNFTYLKASEDFCGSCTACLDACPTNALINEYMLDSNKCISYLTIENKSDIPIEYAGTFNNWLYGCDICQEVCPWNKKFAKITTEEEFYPINGNKEVNLFSIINMEQAEFSQKFRESPVKRTKLKGLQRNALHLKNPL